MARDDYRFLNKRKDSSKYEYKRRIPADIKHMDGRGKSNTWRIVSTGESDPRRAMARRNELEKADDFYWSTLRNAMNAKDDHARYQAVAEINKVYGLKPLDETATVADTMQRFAKLQEVAPPPKPRIAEVPVFYENHRTGEVIETTERREVELHDPVLVSAFLGKHKEPERTVSEVFEWWVENLAHTQTKNKSPDQLRRWRNVRLHAVKVYQDQLGRGAPFAATTRKDALKIFEYLNKRVMGDEIRGDTARKDLSFLRKLWGELAKYEGLDEPNPFRDLAWEKKHDSKPPYSVDFIRHKFLQGDALAGASDEVRSVMLIMIETGCRPTEIINLRAEDIFLDANIPYISVAERDDREQKNEQSIRDIPLVGVSLEAMRHAPNGFPRYADRGSSFSGAANKFLREHGLKETPKHTVYSIRHCFEDRLKDSDIGDDLRRALFGHKEGDTRPRYGSGYTLEKKLEALKKIQLPYDAAILTV